MERWTGVSWLIFSTLKCPLRMPTLCKHQVILVGLWTPHDGKGPLIRKCTIYVSGSFLSKSSHHYVLYFTLMVLKSISKTYDDIVAE